MSGQSIRLHAEGVSVEGDAAYFAFPTGALTYDCVTCGSQCCKGHGYHTAIGPELTRQLDSRRTLPLFLGSLGTQSTAQLLVQNLPPGCFFLAADGRCDIHGAHGYAAKPETCRLFPFNHLRQLGRFLIVRPHPGLCPLGIAAPSHPAPESDHASLLGGLAEFGVTARVGPCDSGGISPETAISVERAIVGISEQYALDGSLLTFVRDQEAAGFAQTSKPTLFVQYEAFINRVLWNGAPPTSTWSEGLRRTLALLTPYLRAHFLFRDFKSDLPPEAPMLEASRLPHAMLVLYLLARDAEAAGMKTFSFQSLCALGQTFEALTVLLANLDRRMVWRRDAAIDAEGFASESERTQFLRFARGLFASNQGPHGALLGDILLSCAPTDPVGRILFLKQCARRSLGRIAPVGKRGKRKPPVRVALQRFLLEYAPEPLLLQTFARRDRRQSQRSLQGETR